MGTRSAHVKPLTKIDLVALECSHAHAHRRLGEIDVRKMQPRDARDESGAAVICGRNGRAFAEALPSLPHEPVGSSHSRSSRESSGRPAYPGPGTDSSRAAVLRTLKPRRPTLACLRSGSNRRTKRCRQSMQCGKSSRVRCSFPKQNLSSFDHASKASSLDPWSNYCPAIFTIELSGSLQPAAPSSVSICFASSQWSRVMEPAP